MHTSSQTMSACPSEVLSSLINCCVCVCVRDGFVFECHEYVPSILNESVTLSVSTLFFYLEDHWYHPGMNQFSYHVGYWKYLCWHKILREFILSRIRKGFLLKCVTDCITESSVQDEVFKSVHLLKSGLSVLFFSLIMLLKYTICNSQAATFFAKQKPINYFLRVIKTA